MCNALGIINFAGNNVNIDGLQFYRPVGAISFLGRYRVIDFPISNFSNSEIENIQVYVRRKPRSLAEHLGTGRHYNINSKRGSLFLLFAEEGMNSLYSNDISAYMDNMEVIENNNNDYVIIAPSYMVYKQDFDALLNQHKESGADITLLYHTTDNAKEQHLGCNILELNKQKGVEAIVKNQGSRKNAQISMDTYIMKKDFFIDLIKKAHSTSSMYTLVDAINEACEEYDIRGIAHRGFFASLTDFKSYFDANLSLIDLKAARTLFTEDWPIYTRTNDSAPTHYFSGANVKGSIVSNGCLVEGTVEGSVIGRGTTIAKGAVVKNCVILSDVEIGKDVVLENVVVDKHAKIKHVKEVICTPENPGYVKRGDRI